MKKGILIAILVLAFFLRFYKVTQVPPSLNWDEVSIGYNAYSILKTGKDEWGKLLPLHFKSYGEYKLPGQIYASIPAIAILGLNDFAVRITPVIYGTLTILFLYFLALELFALVPLRLRLKLGLLSSFLLAVSPWHIQLTRGSFESSFALMWVVLGMWFLVKGFSKPKWWIISMIPFALALYTYNSARVFVPLFLFVIGIVYFRNFVRRKKELFLSLLILLILFLPLVPFIFSGEAAARYKLVSVTDEAGLIPRIEENRNRSILPPTLSNLIHNRFSYSGFYIANNFFAHFTPNFLFIKGAFHKQHHPQGLGELYWIQAPFLLYGFYFLFKKKGKHRWLLVIWLLTAVFPAALTKDIIPHALRTLNAAPVYQIFTAYGGVSAFEFVRRKYSHATFYLLLATSLLVFLFQFLKYQYDYYTTYSIKYSRDWQYGNKQAVDYIKEHYGDYDLVVYTREYGEPHMFTLFYMNYSPANYQNNPNLVRFETYDWVRVLNFDKFYFPDLGDEGTRVSDVIKENPGKKILFVATPDEIPNNMNLLQTINFLDGNVAFKITDVK